ncbi:MAG TPA: histidine ammonia-lyase [Chloroflexia bacterium]|nr:histidine ammonia-lyase [Chloroflexia bacterium]
MHPHSFVSDGTNLTPVDLVRVARSGIPPSNQPTVTVEMSPEAQQRVLASRSIVDDIVARGDLVYGITTGFGAFKDRVIPLDQLAQLQKNLIMSHSAGVGDPLPAEVVRATMLARAHTLSLGYSGISLPTLQLIYDMLNHAIHPVIPTQGSVGASGDLAPLAHMALAMLGLGHVEHHGQTRPAAEALASSQLTPVTLLPKEGLALSNGTSLMSALLSLALIDTVTLSDTADVVAALSIEALQAVPAALDPRIHAARPHAGQSTSASNLRALTQGSTLLWQPQAAGGAPPSTRDPLTLNKVQDPYSLRCTPQVHGPVRDASAYVDNVLSIELNSANDNPLIFPGDRDEGSGVSSIGSSLIPNPSPLSPSYAVLSGGNFHGAPLSLAADFLATAVCSLANISERRQALLLDTKANNGLLPPFLTPNGGLNSGFMIAQYTSASLASENKSLAHPASVDTIPTSANTEDHVSMGPIAARHARAIAANTARVLAIEVLLAAQAIDLRLQAHSHSHSHARLGHGSQAAYDLIRAHIPFLAIDAPIYPYIAAAESLVLSGQFAAILTATDASL